MRQLATSSIKATAAEATTTAKATFTPPASTGSPWHSPVPYLFGGLAAMLGLIAFALLILACSYWKFSGVGEDEAGAAEKGESGPEEKVSPVFEERYLVIMAGEVKPTFLATPSFCKTNERRDCNEKAVIEVRVVDRDQEQTAKEDDDQENGEPSRSSH